MTDESTPETEKRYNTRSNPTTDRSERLERRNTIQATVENERKLKKSSEKRTTESTTESSEPKRRKIIDQTSEMGDNSTVPQTGQQPAPSKSANPTLPDDVQTTTPEDSSLPAEEPTNIDQPQNTFSFENIELQFRFMEILTEMNLPIDAHTVANLSESTVIEFIELHESSERARNDIEIRARERNRADRKRKKENAKNRK